MVKAVDRINMERKDRRGKQRKRDRDWERQREKDEREREIEEKLGKMFSGKSVEMM